MKMTAEYLEHARQFERLAATTTDPKLKAQFLDQAATYRNLAHRRVAQFALADDPIEAARIELKQLSRIIR
jgi:hypothetical protein